MRRLAVASLALVAMAGCGGRDEPVDAAFPTGTESGATAQIVEQVLAPDRVTVRQPAFLDTSVPAASLPVWPGPDPAEFLIPSPPEGLSGELTGQQAAVVYVAAQANPGALWNVGGTVVWLIVSPA